MDLPPDFESSLEAYPIKLANFEGPLDLLIHLIRKNQLNVYDIPQDWRFALRDVFWDKMARLQACGPARPAARGGSFVRTGDGVGS